MAKEKARQEIKSEMSLEEARAYRASLATNQEKDLKPSDKREAFKIFWAKEKKSYKKAEKLEEILWLHLKSMKMDNPEKFSEGLAHFGLRKCK